MRASRKSARGKRGQNIQKAKTQTYTQTNGDAPAVAIWWLLCGAALQHIRLVCSGLVVWCSESMGTALD